MKKCYIGISIFILGFLLCNMASDATMLTGKEKEKESEKTAQIIFDTLDMSEVDNLLEEMFPDNSISLQNLIEDFLNGGSSLSYKTALELLKKLFLGEWEGQKQQLVQLLLLILIASLFYNFSSVFRSGQAWDVGFFVVSMLIFTMCVGNLQDLIEVANARLFMLTEFMKVLSPVYFITTAIATGSTTSLAFYNLVLIAIFFIELLMLRILLPMLQIYLIIRLLNHIGADGRLGKLAELIRTLIDWSLKTIVATVIGLNLVQGILSPALDALKRSTVTKTAEAIPIIGDALGGVTEVMLGTAIVIRNGIGVAGAVICIAIIMVPIIQIGITCLLYKCISALCQPVSDKRILGCVNGIADACRLLLRFVFTAGVLFLITIAVVSNSIRGG